MELQDFFVLSYIFSRELFFSFFRFYAFRGHWRVSLRIIIVILLSLCVLEWSTYFYNGREMKVEALFVFPIICTISSFLLIKVNINKQLFVAITLAHFSMVSQSLAIIMEDMYSHLFIKYMMLSVVFIVCTLIGFFPIKYTLQKYRKIINNVKSEKVFLVVNIILATTWIKILILRDFSRPRDWNLFFDRLFSFLPIIFLIYLILYLLQQMDLNRQIYEKLNVVKKLHESEKHYFDFVVDTWQNARRLRHDLRHHALLLYEYMDNKQYEKIREYLNQFISYNENLHKITLSGNEVIDGIVGYWQMQAKQCGIEFIYKCKIDIEKFHINDVDIAIVLGNALENAYIATKDLIGKEKFIDLKIISHGNILLLVLKNNFTDIKKDKSDGNIKAVKNTDSFHSLGLGRENMKIVVEKYDGIMSVKIKDDIYTLNISLRNKD